MDLLRKFSSSFVLVMIVFTSSSIAQVAASASASATVVIPIAISKTVDMVFGNVAVSSAAGTVTLTPSGNRTVTNGCTLPSTTGSVSAASFTVSGVNGYTYAITLPSSAITLIRLTGNETMTVDNWTSDPGSTGVLTDGSEELNIGATLNVSGSQAPGVYTSATPFTITVNYN